MPQILSLNCNRIATAQMPVRKKKEGSEREIFWDGFAIDKSHCKGFYERYYIFATNCFNKLNPLQICNRVVFEIKLLKIYDRF